MTSDEFSLAVPASPINLHLIRDFVTKVGGRAGLSKVLIHRLELAVDEACSNVIEHNDHESERVTVKVSFDEDAVRVSIVDTGHQFDPRMAPARSLEVKKLKRTRNEASRGLGIPLLRTLMDQIDYHVLPDNTNELQLILRRA